MKVLPVVSVLACLSCSPVVESGPGVILCEEVEDCDDDNDCTTETCEDRGVCRFVSLPDGEACFELDGPGVCAEAACVPAE